MQFRVRSSGGAKRNERQDEKRKSHGSPAESGSPNHRGAPGAPARGGGHVQVARGKLVRKSQPAEERTLSETRPPWARAVRGRSEERQGAQPSSRDESPRNFARAVHRPERLCV